MTTDLNKPVSTAIQAALKLKATTSALSKTSVGLVNVNNTNDLLKPISSSNQAALTVKKIPPIWVRHLLVNVDNTSDLLKPVSNATQTTLNTKVGWVYDGLRFVSFVTLDAASTYIYMTSKESWANAPKS